MENLIPYEKLKLEKILGKVNWLRFIATHPKTATVRDINTSPPKKQGQFGAVYRGVLDGLDVAVKKIPQDVAQVPVLWGEERGSTRVCV